MDFPNVLSPVPTHITTFSRYSCTTALRVLGNSAGPGNGAAWALANQAIYTPIFLPWPYTAKRFFWVNGSAITINADVGLYTPGGAKLFTAGATAQSGASAPQYITPGTSLQLSPGWYYLGVQFSNTTANCVFGISITQHILRGAGVLQQNVGSAGLPASAGYAAMSLTSTVPVAGFTNTASGF